MFRLGAEPRAGAGAASAPQRRPRHATERSGAPPASKGGRNLGDWRLRKRPSRGPRALRRRAVRGGGRNTAKTARKRQPASQRRAELGHGSHGLRTGQPSRARRRWRLVARRAAEFLRAGDRQTAMALCSICGGDALSAPDDTAAMVDGARTDGGAIAVAVVSGIVAIGFPVSPWARPSPPGRGAEALVAFAAATARSMRVRPVGRRASSSRPSTGSSTGAPSSSTR